MDIAMRILIFNDAGARGQIYGIDYFDTWGLIGRKPEQLL